MIFNTATQEQVNEINSNLGKIYQSEENTISTSGVWAIGATLIVPAGTYIVIRKCYSTDDSASFLFGRGYQTGNYTQGIGNGIAMFVNIVEATENYTFNNFVYGGGSFVNDITAIKIK